MSRPPFPTMLSVLGITALLVFVVGLPPAGAEEGRIEPNSVTAYGSAADHDPADGMRLARGLVDMASHPSGDGYWLVASDGGVFSFGSATFHGSTGGQRLPAPIVGMAAASSGNGYWLAGRDGQVYAQGVTDHGNAAESEQAVRPPVVAIAARGGDGYWLPTASAWRRTTRTWVRTSSASSGA